MGSLPPDLTEAAWPPPDWTLYQDGSFEIVYDRFDWTNEAGRVGHS